MLCAAPLLLLLQAPLPVLAQAPLPVLLQALPLEPCIAPLLVPLLAPLLVRVPLLPLAAAAPPKAAFSFAAALAP